MTGMVSELTMKMAKILAMAAIASSFLLLLAVVVFRSPQHVQTTIDLLKVISAWPPIFLALALYFMHRYHEEIRSFLHRATEVGPGGIKAAERQLPPPEPPPTELAQADTPPEPVSPSGEGQKQLTIFEGETPGTSGPETPTEADEESKDQKTVTLPEKLLKNLMREYAEARAQRESWKLQFLDQFLVYNTKNVLAWFETISGSTLTNYHRTWRYTIPAEDQRATVIDVLLEYGLLGPTPVGLQITDEGRRALEYFRERGLPVAPPTPPPSDPKALEALGRAMGLPPSAEPRAPHQPNRFLEALMKRREAKESEPGDRTPPAAPGGG